MLRKYSGIPRPQHLAHQPGHHHEHRHQTRLLYIQLSGHDLAAKLARGMAEIHAWRARAAAEVLR